MIYCGATDPKAMTQPPWTEASATMSQNKYFLLLVGFIRCIVIAMES
jgi:hypothetical protein